MGDALTILHTESSMNMGGQELRILMEMEGLKGRGYNSVLAARPGSRILGEAVGRGLKAYPVGMRGSIDPAAVSAFARIISREKADIVNAHGSKDGWSAGIAARLLGKKVVRSRHIANPIRGSFFGRLVYGPLCDRIMTTSESIKRGIAEKGVAEGKILSIPTGVDTSRFHPGVDGSSFRAELGIKGSSPLVGMVSVMRGDKGPDVFFKSAEAVLGRMPEAYFVLVGDGWMKGRLEDMASASPYRERIRLTGYRRDIPSVLAALDLMVLPALVPEGIPQAVLQAHAMKVPVVASDVGGINEVAINGSTAVCVPPGDEAALADAIVMLLKDTEMAATLSSAGYGLVMERYTLPGMLDRVDAFYRDVVRG